jgi:hypothetical protein
MIAASPAFGLELSEAQRESWDDLVSRCAVSRRFRLLCLSPLSQTGDKSPLDEFVNALASYPSLATPAERFRLLALSRMNVVGHLIGSNPTAVVRVGFEPPF